MTRTLPRRPPVRLLAAGLALLAGVATAGCEPVKAGAAAVVGDERIATAELHAAVEGITEAQERAGGGHLPEGDLQRGVLSRKIIAVVVREAADRHDILVTRGQVDDRLDELAGGMGGRKRFEEAVLGDGVAPAELPGLVRVTLTLDELGRRLVPGSGQQAQLERQQVIGRVLTRISRSLGITVNPRFGRWNAQRATVVEASGSLSTPAPGSESGGAAGGGAPLP